MKLSWRIAIGIIGLIGIAACIGLLFALVSRPANVRIGQAVLNAKVLVTESEREKGLSGTSSLEEADAMLFVFPSDDKWGIWMKDMKYPIDIAWLDSNKIVKHLVENAQPSSYPTIFRPDQDVRYVLEMKAGTAKHKSITIGTRAEFTQP